MTATREPLLEDRDAAAAEPDRRAFRADVDFGRPGTPEWSSSSGSREFVGPGTIEIEPSIVTLRGRRRTWRDRSVEHVVPLAPQSVCNVLRDGNRVRFQTGGTGRPRVFEFRAPDEDAAVAIVSRLPVRETPGFREHVEIAREFRARLQRRSGRAYVTPVLVGLNVLAFVALIAANGGALAFRPDVLAAWGANVGALTTHGEWWRLLTAAFLHLGLAHLALNAWALWSIGRETERYYGSVTYAAIYLATAVLASLGSVAWDPSRTSVGASGAIFGIGGAFLAFLARRDTNVPAGIARTHWVATGVFVAVSLGAGAVIPGIDNAAHLAGLVAGFALGWLLARPLGEEARTTALHAKTGAAGAIAALALLGGMAFVRAPQPRADDLHAFWTAHPWYASGERESLAAWERLVTRAESGRLPMPEFAATLERDVLPFWQQAFERLDAERREHGASPLRDRVLEFARLRRDLALAQIAAARNDGDLDPARPLAEAAMLAQARIEYVTLRESVALQARGLVARVPVHRLRTLVATRGRCLHPPAGAVPGLPSPLDSAHDAPALRLAASCEAQRLFVEERYRELDALLVEFAAHPNDLPDGTSSLSGAYSGFDYLFVQGRLDVRQVLRQLNDWRREVPGSVQPELVESQALRAWARQAVRPGGRTTSSDAQLRRFRDEMADEALRMAREAGASHPVWYTQSLAGAVDDPDGLVAGRALFDAGVERFPGHYPIYYGMLRLLQPRVHGSFEQVAAFVDEVTAHAPEEERDTLYARLYAHYATLEGDDADIFANARADWPRIERGFRRLLERHPGSDYLLNTFANLACRRGDVPVYLSLRREMAMRRSFAAWQGKVQPESCDERMRSLAGSGPALGPAAVPRFSDLLPRRTDTELAAADAARVRRQVRAALAASEPMKRAVVAYAVANRQLPDPARVGEAPEFRPVEVDGTRVRLGVGGMIEIGLTDGPLAGREFSWIPVAKDGSLGWTCAQGNVPKAYLAPPCG